jgi:hypothetical protein
MEEAPRTHLVVLQGGRTGAEPRGAEPALTRDAVRVIPGGPAGEVQAAIEETVLAARKMRQEIEARIAHALEEAGL